MLQATHDPEEFDESVRRELRNYLLPVLPQRQGLSKFVVGVWAEQSVLAEDCVDDQARQETKPRAAPEPQQSRRNARATDAATYTNTTVVGVSIDELNGLVSPPAMMAQAGDCVVVFSLQDEHDGGVLAASITSRLRVVAVTVCVIDDEILIVDAYRDGARVAYGADPNPEEHFGLDLSEFEGFQPDGENSFADPSTPAPTPPLDPAQLVEAIGRGRVEDVQAVRQWSRTRQRSPRGAG